MSYCPLNVWCLSHLACTTRNSLLSYPDTHLPVDTPFFLSNRVMLDQSVIISFSLSISFSIGETDRPPVRCLENETLANLRLFLIAFFIVRKHHLCHGCSHPLPAALHFILPCLCKASGARAERSKRIKRVFSGKPSQLTHGHAYNISHALSFRHRSTNTCMPSCRCGMQSSSLPSFLTMSCWKICPLQASSKSRAHVMLTMEQT